MKSGLLTQLVVSHENLSTILSTGLSVIVRGVALEKIR